MTPTATITISPVTVRMLAYQEFRDSEEDLCGHVPQVDHWTPETTDKLNRDLTICLSALWRLNDAVDRVAYCDGVRRA